MSVLERLQKCRSVFCMHIYKRARITLSLGALFNAWSAPVCCLRLAVLAHCSATVKYCIMASKDESSELSPLGHTWNLRAFLRQRGVTRPETPLLLFPTICVSLTYFLWLYLFPALRLHSRVMGHVLSGKPISFSVFLYFYPIMPRSEVSKATWRFYWDLIKDLWFNPCNLIEMSLECETLALCIGEWHWCFVIPAFCHTRSGLKWFALWLVSMYGV